MRLKLSAIYFCLAISCPWINSYANCEHELVPQTAAELIGRVRDPQYPPDWIEVVQNSRTKRIPGPIALKADGVPVKRIEVRPTASGETELWLVDEYWIPKTEAKVGYVETLPADSVLYHWGPTEQIEWAEKGFPNTAEHKERIARMPGYYITSDIADTTQYGPVLVILETTRPLKIARFDEDALNAHRNDSDISDLDKLAQLHSTGVSGVRPRIMQGRDAKWFSIYEPTTAFGLRLAKQEDFLKSELFRSGQLRIDELLLIDRRYELTDLSLLQSHYSSLFRAVMDQPITTDEAKFLETQLGKLTPSTYRYSDGNESPGPLEQKLRRRLGL